MAAQGGFGLVLKIDVSASLTAIAGVKDVDFPKFKKFLAESTGHDATSGYYTAVASGKRRLEPIRATLYWDTSVNTHAEIVTMFASDDPTDMSIADPDGDETIAFSAHIEAIGRISKQEDAYEAVVDIHPTGPATIS